MTPDVFARWREVDLDFPPYVLPGDMAVVDSSDTDRCIRYARWLEAGGPGPAPDSRLHVDLLPAPFIGDVANAKVLILLLNPGFDALCYHEELAVPGIRQRYLRAIRQRFDDDPYPFHFLDPALAWTGGFRWWHGRLAGVIERLAHHDAWGCAYAEARKRVAGAIAAVQAVPYHSETNGLTHAEITRMTSFTIARDYVMSRVKDGRTTVLVMRSHELWKLPSPGPMLFAKERSLRGIHFTPGSDATEALVRALTDRPHVA